MATSNVSGITHIYDDSSNEPYFDRDEETITHCHLNLNPEEVTSIEEVERHIQKVQACMQRHLKLGQDLLDKEQERSLVREINNTPFGPSRPIAGLPRPEPKTTREVNRRDLVREHIRGDQPLLQALQNRKKILKSRVLDQMAKFFENKKGV